MAEYIERTEELILAMNAGARAIENTKRYHGAVYTKDVFSESPQEIPYLQAAKVLREVSDASAADVAPVVYGRWECVYDDRTGETYITCSHCKNTRTVNGCFVSTDGKSCYFEDDYCPNCSAKMDGGDGDAAD
mgnify:CR=1 FL=1|jgi:hypothetical protein|nr:MAG TPA: zinc-ribbon domain protein [Caudoviricetes sp.]